MTEKVEISIKGGEELERTGKFIKPNVTDLRNWDANLLGRFKPKYYAFIQQCQYCAFGPCDLSKNRKGACGMRLNPQMAREALVMVIAGASSYIARSCELNDTIIKEHTYVSELNLEDKNFTGFINLLCGYEPKTAGNLKKALRYANEQIVHLISATHMGQEASDFDFNSKIFHAGMLSLLGMEIYEILRKFSNNNNNNKGNKINKFEIGFGAIDKSKGIVLIIGDYVPNIDKSINSKTNFETIYLGPDAFDFSNTTIGGNFTSELIYEKINLADVIVIGTGNVRTDVIENVKKFGIPIIAVSDRNMAGLADLSGLMAGEIFKRLMSREISGCYIKDSEKLADVIGMIATVNEKGRNLKNSDIENTDAGLIKTTGECINCGLCKKACPINTDTHLLIQSINQMFNLHLHSEEQNKDNAENKADENILKSKDRIINLLKQKEYTTTVLSKEIGCSRQYIYKVLEKISKEKGLELSKRNVGKEIYYALIKGLNEYYKITGQVKECIGCKICSGNCPNNIQIAGIVIGIKEGKEIKAKEIAILKKCAMCGLCQEKCPKKINIKEVVRVERERRNIIEDTKFLTKEEILNALGKCIFCGRCESWCPRQIPIASVFAEIYKEKFMNKKASLTLSHDIFVSEDAQVLLVLGDANFPNGTQELAEILGEFLNRNFLIFTAGDAAISIAESNLKHENLINLGPASAGIHLIEKIIAMAGKDLNKSPVGNFDEIAAHIANKVSVAAIFWGATTQENFAVAQGLMRLGIPVIFGQQGIKYRRELRGDIVIDYSRDDYNGNYNEILKKISLKNFSFQHLCIAANTKEEAMLLIPKLVFRNFDSEDVRATKIANYIEIFRKYTADKTKEIPDDIKNFVRSEKDIPGAYKNRIQK
ncbi:MAG: hypothetical protein BWK75_00520 [Candidatus Altiarchaeales archaeon A3]|nr:MAG: hypothetical protein BWK75_00520 [Candidatus Altiarchaeales archaeon A3]